MCYVQREAVTLRSSVLHRALLPILIFFFYATILIKVGWRIALRGLEVNIVGSIVGRLDVSQVEVSGVQDLGKAGLVIRLRVGVWLETVVRLQWQSVRSGALAW